MADRFTVIVTDQAQEQLEATKQYYIHQLNAQEAALDFVELMGETFEELEKFPKRARLVEDEPWHSQGIHILPIKTHNVYFWIDEEAGNVWVTAVIAARMDQRKQLKKMRIK